MSRLLDRHSKTKLRQSSWKISKLESRLMLAGDVGAAVASPAGQVAACTGATECETASHRSLVLVDQRVEDIAALELGIDQSAELILVSPDQDAIELISRTLAASPSKTTSLHIVCHGQDGGLILGNSVVDAEQLKLRQGDVAAWSQSLTDSADILLYGCDVTASEVGISFIESLAQLTRADVAGSSNRTGAIGAISGDTTGDADWVLENATGQIESSLAFDSSTRRSYEHTLNIIINAWGQTGEESFDLQIDGQTVQSYDAATTWTPFVYETNEDISGDRVRIAFTNDAYDPSQNLDRNLFVNNIQINGTNYESAGEDTFSTGTWLPADGVTSGFGRGNVLHSNGYFQYGGEEETSTVQVKIEASGQTGDEIMQVRIGRAGVVAEIQVSTERQEYIVTANESVNIKGLTIEFVNDAYDESTSYDRNLTVYSVEHFNSDTGVTEVATPGDFDVFSTGTWLPQDGISPGFGRGNILHGDGVFTFGHTTSNEAAIQLDDSFADDGIALTSASQNVATDGGSRIVSNHQAEIQVRNRSGQLDTNFSGDGIVDLRDEIGDSVGYVEGQSVIRIQDFDFSITGSLHVVGTIQTTNGFGQPEEIFTAAFDRSGNLLSGYNHGIVEGSQIDLGNFNGGIQAEVDTSFRTLILGEKVREVGNDNDQNTDLVVTRLDSSGNLDTSFGDDGSTVIDRPLSTTSATRILELQRDRLTGNILLSGATSREAFVAQLDDNGNLDSSFGDGGTTVVDLSVADAVVDNEGRIVLGGTDNGYTAVRLLANGELDQTFGDAGRASALLNPAITLLQRSFSSLGTDDVVVTGDGSVLLISPATHTVVGRAGAGSAVENAGTIVLRFDPGGQLDTSFGTNGYSLIPVGAGGIDSLNAVVDNFGGLLIGGSLFVDTDGFSGEQGLGRYKFV